MGIMERLVGIFDRPYIRVIFMLGYATYLGFAIYAQIKKSQVQDLKIKQFNSKTGVTENIK